MAQDDKESSPERLPTRSVSYSHSEAGFRPAPERGKNLRFFPSRSLFPSTLRGLICESLIGRPTRLSGLAGLNGLHISEYRRV